MNKVYLAKKLFEKAWVKERVNELKLEEIRRKLKDRIEKFRSCGFFVNGRVLDVGTGGGIDLLALFSISPGLEAVAVDLCRGALEFAKSVLPKDFTHFIVADATHLPFQNESFDAINVSNMLHHHPLRLLRRILQSLTTLLKDGGIMLIQEPSVESENEALREEIEILKSDFETYSRMREKMAAPSEEIQAYFYNLIPMFRYGTTYPSLLKKAIEESNLRIELFQVVVKKYKLEESRMISKIERSIRESNLPDFEKDYLREKVEAIKEKIKLIKPCGYKIAIFKAKKERELNN